MWIRGKCSRLSEFLSESVQLPFAEPPLKERTSVNAGRGVTLEEHLISAADVIGTFEEVVETDFVQRGC